MENQLLKTVKRNNIDALKIFLKSGADPNAKDNHGQRALIYASAKKNFEIVKFLIKNDADTN